MQRLAQVSVSLNADLGLDLDPDLEQVLGGAGRVQPGRAAAGPGHQPPGLLLPRLPHPQVRLPGLVHGPGGVERERRHLQ